MKIAITSVITTLVFMYTLGFNFESISNLSTGETLYSLTFLLIFSMITALLIGSVRKLIRSI